MNQAQIIDTKWLANVREGERYAAGDYARDQKSPTFLSAYTKNTTVLCMYFNPPPLSRRFSFRSLYNLHTLLDKFNHFLHTYILYSSSHHQKVESDG